MAKTVSRSMRTQPILHTATRGRATEVPVAQTLHVSGEAQTKIVDLDMPRQFEVSPQGRVGLPERPSTSGGPAKSDFATTRRNPEKRETRDDLHLNPLAAHGRGTTFYNFPLPGSVPSLAQAPRSSSPTPFPYRNSSLSGSARSRTSVLLEGGPAGMDDHGSIGMALGSPAHPPLQFLERPSWSQDQPQAQYQTFRVASPEEMDSSVDGLNESPAPPKQKGGRWKLFGGLFGGGKKHGPAPTPFYQVQPEVGNQGQKSVGSDSVNFESPPATANGKPEKPRGRGRTASERKTSKNKPDMQRSYTAPHNGPENVDFDTWKEKKKPGAPQIMLDGGPMLDVDIPSVHMERYSVMFGSVLKPNAASSSALLARRQATLDKLKTVNDALREKERELEEKEERLLRPRRATSPQPSKSPGFSLFPNTPSRLTTRDPSPSTPRHISPLQRSNTAPGALSPSKASFEESRTSNDEPFPNGMPVKAPPIAPPPQQSQTKDSSQAGRNAHNTRSKHQPIVVQFSQDESHLDLTSPSSSIMSCENDVYDPALFLGKPKIISPAWEMVSRHPTAGAGSTSSESTINSASSAATSVSSPLEPLPLPPSRPRAGTVTTNSTLSTSSMEVPIAFAQPPVRERTTNGPSKLKNNTTAEETRPPPQTYATRMASNLPHSRETASADKTQLQMQGSHQKDASSGSISFSASRAEEALTDDEQRIRSAADVSIARQISLSRQQRQLLVPIQKSNSTSTSPTSQKSSSPSPSISSQRNMARDPNIPSPLGSNRVGPSVISGPMNLQGRSEQGPRINVNTEWNGLGERLVDSPVKALTPTLVVVPGPVEKRSKIPQPNTGSLSSVEGGNLELHHRKSARGVVEHA